MLKMEDIVSIEVISADARVAGEVEGMAVDVEDWMIPALRIALKKGVEDTVGVKKPLLGYAKLYIKTDAVDSISDTLTLKANLSDLKEITIEGGSVVTTASDVIGKRVICRRARQIGFAENILFSPDKGWTVPYIEVKLDKSAIDDLNVKKPLLTTPTIRVQTTDIKTIGDMIMLKIDHEELRDFLEKKPSLKK